MKLCTNCMGDHLTANIRLLKLPDICDRCGSPGAVFLIPAKIDKLIEKLEPYAMGCFSGKVSDWPELKPLLKEIFDYLVAIND